MKDNELLSCLFPCFGPTVRSELAYLFTSKVQSEFLLTVNTFLHTTGYYIIPESAHGFVVFWFKLHKIIITSIVIIKVLYISIRI